MSPFRLTLPSPRRTAAILHLLAAGPVWALAEVRVALTPPPAPLEAGQSYLVLPTVTGAGDEVGCWFALAQDGRLLAAPDSPRLSPWKGGGAVLTLGADWRGECLLRATSRADPSAFTVVSFQVAPKGSAGTALETKAGEGAPAPWTLVPAPAEPAPAPPPQPYVWTTRFKPPYAYGARKPNIWHITWDRTTPQPSLLAVCADDHSKNTLVRMGMDGSGTVLLTADPGLARLTGARYQEQDQGMTYLYNVLVRSGGEILFTLGRPSRLYQMSRDGKDLKVIAGTGQAEPAFDPDAPGQPPLATEANLNDINQVVVTPRDEIVFTSGAWILRIDAAGRLEVLAGNAKADKVGPLDLRRRFPATAGGTGQLNALGTAPDGRILACGGAGWLALFPDGTLSILRAPKTIAQFFDGTESVVTGVDDSSMVARYLMDPMGLGIAATTSNEVHFHTSSHVYRLLPGEEGEARIETLNPQKENAGPTVPVGPADQVPLGDILQVTRAPGGGMWVLNRNGGIFYLGPGRGEAALAGQVDKAVAAAEKGDRKRYDEIRAALLEWTANPGKTYRDRVLLPALGQGNQPMEMGPRSVLAPLVKDAGGMGYRAALALDAIAARAAHLPEGWLARSATGFNNLWTLTLEAPARTVATRILPCVKDQVFEGRCTLHTEHLTRGQVRFGFVFLDSPPQGTPARRLGQSEPVSGPPAGFQAAGPVQVVARGTAPEGASRVQVAAELVGANAGARVRIESLRFRMLPPAEAPDRNSPDQPAPGKAASPELWFTELAGGHPGATEVRYLPCVAGEAFLGLCQARAEGAGAQAHLGMVFQHAEPGGTVRDLAAAHAPEGAADGTRSDQWATLAVRGGAPKGTNRVKVFLQCREGGADAKAVFRSVNVRLLPPEALAAKVAGALETKGSAASEPAADTQASSNLEDVD